MEVTNVVIYFAENSEEDDLSSNSRVRRKLPMTPGEMNTSYDDERSE